MKKASLILNVLFALPGFAAVNVPLTVQEAIYPGSTPGISRTGDPVTVGIPLPDDPTTGVTDISQLKLTGASVGQFRVLGRWPSGRIKWVLVDTQANITAGQPNTSIVLTDGGSGNFGGANLATDNGATITVNTGASTYVVKKANFNGFDSVVVGSTTMVTSGASEGLVLMGPQFSLGYPANTQCGVCTTPYKSSSDSTSTAVIEENGPAKAVIKATGSLVDGSGNVYMTYTVREFFYTGKPYAKVQVELQNAANTPVGQVKDVFASANKGFASFELRLALTPTMSQFAFGGPSGVISGSYAAAENASLYSGYTTAFQPRGGDPDTYDSPSWVSPIPRTACSDGGDDQWCYPDNSRSQEGYRVVKGATTLSTGTRSQYPVGWGDVSNASGTGVMLGVYQMAAYWPKSIEFNNGGSTAVIGIWPKGNSVPYYQAWPQHSIHDVYFWPHASSLTSASNSFLGLQHYLIARAPFTQYNASNVFPFPLLGAAAETSYYNSVSVPNVLPTSYTCCLLDMGVGALNRLSIPRFYSWTAGGGSNQADLRWADLTQWITWGLPGRYTYASWFYRYQNESLMARSDGFSWSSHPFSPDRCCAFDRNGDPAIPSANPTQVTTPINRWCDDLHCHWYGMTDYYFMTGDESIKQFILEMPKVKWTDPTIPWNNGFGVISRGVGIWLMSAARIHDFLSAIGDPAAPTVFSTVDNLLTNQIYPALVTPSTNFSTIGTDPNRGVFWGCAPADGQGPCPNAISWPIPPATTGPAGWGAGTARYASTFLQSILLEGEYEYARAHGQQWTDYNKLMDIAYGGSQWVLNEMKVDTGNYATSRVRYYIALDYPNAAGSAGSGLPNCTIYPAPPYTDCTPENNMYSPQTIWMPFWISAIHAGDVSWANFYAQMIQRNFNSGYWNFDEYATPYLNAAISQIQNPPNRLTDLPFTVVDQGGGNYQITATPPTGAQFYRVKYSAKTIVPWLNFDPMVTNSFGINPASNQPWFSATNATGIPAPGTAGQPQTFTVNAGTAGLKAANFSVKVMAPAGSVPAGQPTTITKVSGDSPVQSSTPGAQLTNPFVVKVTDANNTAVSGTVVTFAVSSGGGSLVGGAGTPSSLQVTTNASGLASAILILGSVTGTNTVTASAGGLTNSPIVFTAAAATSAATTISKVSGDNPVQSAPVSTQLANGFIVKVTDNGSNPVIGVTVTFTVASGGGTLIGGSGSPSTLQVSTDASGQASATLVVGAVAGSNSVTASATALTNSPLTFNATGTSGAAPTGGTPLPVNTWTTVNTDGYPVQAVGWEHLIWDKSVHRAVMLGGYKAPGSEPNTGLVAYNFTSNRWDVLDVLSSFHTEHHPEAGHPDGPFGYNPASGTIAYNCCYSGSSVADTSDYVWMFDTVGQIGKNNQTTTMPAYFANSYGTFDAGTNKLITLDPNGSGAWVYDYATNKWTNPAQTGTPPVSACLQMGAADYNSTNHLTYWFGGYNGASYCGTLYTYNSTTNAWAQLSPSCPAGCPGARAYEAFAYDSLHNVFLMFGGTGSWGVSVFNETWVLDPAGDGGQGTWTQLAPAATLALNPTFGVPSYRLVFDADDNAFILAMPGTGGAFYSGGTMNAYPVQTWFFRYSGSGPNIGNTPTVYTTAGGSMNKNAGAVQAAGRLWNGGWATEADITSDGTSGYAAWVELGLPFDTNNSGMAHVYVKQLPGTFLGGAYNSVSIDGGGAEKPSVAFVNGTLWESHSEYSQTTTAISYLVAKRWNGTTWTGGRVPPMTPGCPCEYGVSKLMGIGSTPYMALIEQNRSNAPWEYDVWVASWNGSTWAPLGSKLNRLSGVTKAEAISIGSNGTNPIVAWSELTVGGGIGPAGAVASPSQVFVSQWNGSAWTALGGSLNQNAGSWASYPSISYVNGKPMVCWAERPPTGNAQLYCASWSGSAWSLLGAGSLNKNLSTGWAFAPSTATDGTSLYVSWVEQNPGQGGKVYTSAWNGTAWAALGSSSQNVGAGSSAEHVKLAIVGGKPAATWSEVTFGTPRQVYAGQWNGTSWSLLTGSVPLQQQPTCDLNSDGSVNVVDVQMSIAQALGLSACTTADLQQNGVCDVIDVQRVINASFGSACVIGH